jgi:predicted ATP-grasp superfamily ATP-dependent carboligase
VVRSLGRRGIAVWVVRTDEHSLACASRYAQRSLDWPRGCGSAKVDYLLTLARRHGLDRWTLVPTCDETALLLANHRGWLERRYVVAAPSAEKMAVAYDKRATYAFADAAGIDQPWTMFPTCRADLAAADVSFPAILKPAFKPDANCFTAAKAWRVDSRDELLARYDEARTLVPPEVLMVQELIPGGPGAQLSHAALCEDGELIATVSAVRLRQQPMDFGKASCHVETTKDGDFAVAAKHLLRELRFTGLAEVEFKRDERDGRPKLLDINARVWGWHSLCERAGVDFPWLQWQLLHGRRPSVSQARPGVRWVRLTTDLPTGARELVARRLTARGYLSTLRPPIAEAIFAADDPLPALVDLPLLAGIAVRRARRSDERSEHMGTTGAAATSVAVLPLDGRKPEAAKTSVIALPLNGRKPEAAKTVGLSMPANARKSLPR